MARVLTLFVIGAFVAASMAVADAQSGRPATGFPQHAADANSKNHTTQPDRTHEAGTKPGRAPGRLNVTNETVEGRYITFTLDLSRCSISEYRVYGVRLLARVQLPASGCKWSRPGASGAGFEMRVNGSRLRVHDAPNALLQFVGSGGNVTLAFDPGVQIASENETFRFAVANLTGDVFGERDQDDGLTGTPPLLEGPAGTLMVHPASGVSTERRAILDAIKHGHVGAEVDVLAEDGHLVTDEFSFHGVDVHMRHGAKDRVDFTVSGNASVGSAIVTNFDPAAFDPHEVRIDYADVADDGSEHPARIHAAASLDEVLALGNKEPAYFAYEDGEGWHVALAVPHFSVHIFQVVGIPLQVVPLILYGMVIVGLAFVTGGVGVFLERRARNK